MASYHLIKETGDEGTLHLRGRDCALRIDDDNDGDVESAFQKFNQPSPRLKKGFDSCNGSNAASFKSSPPLSGSARLASLDIFRGLTVAVNSSFLFLLGFCYLGQLPSF